MKIYNHNKISGRKINVALIGCGRISNRHIQAILKNQDNLILNAICDSDEEKLINKKNIILKEQIKNNTANKLNIYKSYETLLKDVQKGI